MEVVVESKGSEGLLSVRVVLGEIELSPMERESIAPGLWLGKTFEGLVKLRLGGETLGFGALCLHRGQLAVRVAKIAHSASGNPPEAVASGHESEKM
ncbi:MAG: hypothetical protein ACK5EA_01440 [Planctomycetaceae bacterium]|jgi:hypothetical protein